MVRAFSPSFYCYLNPGASPQAGIIPRLQRLNPNRTTNWRALKARSISAWGEAPGGSCRKQQRAEGPPHLVLRQSVESRPHSFLFTIFETDKYYVPGIMMISSLQGVSFSHSVSVMRYIFSIPTPPRSGKKILGSTARTMPAFN
jgi:hypothetical protein